MHIESGPRRGGNIELNIVPMIDLMSCMTAFLLVTAVWSSVAQIPAKPQTRGHSTVSNPPATLWVLVEADQIRLARSDQRGEIATLTRAADGGWDEVDTALRGHHDAVDDLRVQVSAESSDASPVRYQALVDVMDHAHRAGFADVDIIDPHSVAVWNTL